MPPDPNLSPPLLAPSHSSAAFLSTLCARLFLSLNPSCTSLVRPSHRFTGCIHMALKQWHWQDMGPRCKAPGQNKKRLKNGPRQLKKLEVRAHRKRKGLKQVRSPPPPPPTHTHTAGSAVPPGPSSAQCLLPCAVSGAETRRLSAQQLLAGLRCHVTSPSRYLPPLHWCIFSTLSSQMPTRWRSERTTPNQQATCTFAD